jgi:hypothetical protein
MLPTNESSIERSLAKFVQIMLYASPAIMVGILISAAVVLSTNPKLYTPRDINEVGIRTTGVVVGYAETTEQDGTVYAPVIEFRTPDGTLVTWPSESYSNPPGYRLGERVTILYDPQSPDRARIIPE